MFRKMGVLTGAVVLGLALAAQSVGAATAAPMPAGNITCALTGTMKFAKPLPNANSDTGSLKNVHVKIDATLTNCVAPGAGTGGKAPITGGSLTATGILEAGASCADISDGSAPDFTFDTNKLQVTWKGTVGKGHPTVGKSKTDVFSTGDVIFGGWEYFSDSFGENDAFANEYADIDLGLNSASGLNVRQCMLGQNTAAGAPVTIAQANFDPTNGSKITISPDFPS